MPPIMLCGAFFRTFEDLRTSYTVTSAVIDWLWEALNAPSRQLDAWVRRQLIGFAESGWASASEVRDLLEDSDGRLATGGGLRDHLEDLLQAFRLPTRTVYRRPGRRSASVVGFEKLAASDLAQLLMLVEQLGFGVDPQPLAATLLPGITTKDSITESELSIFWFEKSRHRTSPVELLVQGAAIDWRSEQTLRTATGYKVTLFRDVGGDPARMVVDAPKHRRKSSPVETTCAECGYRWWKGDPDSSAGHCREQGKRMAILDPKPSATYAAARQVEAEPWLVRAGSPWWKHREMHQRARAFKREFGYDLVQCSHRGDDPNAHGFLFADDADRILGACAFRLRQNDTGSWRGMQWIWMCPLARRTGILTRWWPEFERRFGTFDPEPPFSDAMQGFIDKRSAAAVIAEAVG